MSLAPAGGTPGLVAGVDVLQRAVDHLLGALDGLDGPGASGLAAPTPCPAWTLGDLLAHLEDGVDAFADAAGGTVGLHVAEPTPLARRVVVLRRKAGALVGAWLEADAAPVAVAGRPLAADAVARVAALEIAVHAWDVDMARGRSRRLPDVLAEALLPTAVRLARSPAGRFAAPVGQGDGVVGVIGGDGSDGGDGGDGVAGARLLATLGRRPG